MKQNLPLKLNFEELIIIDKYFDILHFGRIK